MQTLDDIRTEILRLKWHVAAWRFRRALHRYALTTKAGFNPDQPRDEEGRWVEAEGGEDKTGEGSGTSDATDVSAVERPRPGRISPIGVAVELAQRLIEAFRSENGFRDLFGYSANRAVAVTTVDGETIFGSSGRSPTFSDVDRYDAELMRSILVEKRPDVMNTGNLGQFPNDALFHAEANVLMRAARKSGGSLAGRELEVHVDRPMCESCKRVLPLLALEIGNPTVRFVDNRGTMLVLRDGSWAD